MSSNPSSAATTDALKREWVSIKCDDRIFTLLRMAIAAAAPNSLLAQLFPPSDNTDDDGEDDTASAFLSPMGIPVYRDMTHPLQPFVFDRNPRYVEPLFNFLRTGELIIDEGVSKRGVYHEALYFGVDEVVAQLQHIEAPDHGPAVPSATTSYSRRDLESFAISGKVDRFCGINFAGADFSGLNLSDARFERCVLTKADFSGCTLDGATFTECDMKQAKMTRSSLCRARIHKCTLDSANLDRSKLHGACCSENDFYHASMVDASCSFASFAKSLMCGVDATRCLFQQADLSEVNMSEATLKGAEFTGATMRRAVLHGVEREGVNLSMGGVLS